MADSKAANLMARYDVPILRAMQPYLAALVATGLYGLSPEAVLRELIAQGLRQAVRDGLIPTRFAGDQVAGSQTGA
jgi:hypothetical protein